MAILGFLVHTHTKNCAAVEAEVAAMPEMTTYGIHQNCYIVSVAEAPQEELEFVLGKVYAINGVLTCYVTSLTVEDEQEPME